MNSEALRLLEKIRRDVNDVMNNTRTFSTKDAALLFIMADIDRLRAVVSAQEPTGDRRQQAYALERCIDSQRAFAARLELANPEDPYVALMIHDDAATLEKLRDSIWRELAKQEAK